MNRHSPLFRVAFLSLIMAIGLPLLVFTAAHVRHRQLQSTANPRWAKFAEINGTARVDRPAIRNTAERKLSATASPTPNRISVKPISQPTGPSDDRVAQAEPKPPAEEIFETSTRVEQESAAPIVRTAPRPEEHSPRLDASSSTETLERPTAVQARAKPVPFPDDESEPPLPRKPANTATIEPFVVLRPANENEGLPKETSSPRLEARLAGLQRRIDQLAQLQTDQKISDLDRTLNLLQQLQQTPQAPAPNQRPFDSPQPGLNGPVAPIPARQLPPTPSDDVSPNTTSSPNGKRDARTREPSIKIVQGDQHDDEERFSIQVQDANLTEVLEMLAQLSGVNILTSRDVQGRVSLNLQDITVDRALDAILKSQGCVFERERDFIYVRTAEEDVAMKQANRKLISKVYQLHFINANELQKLLDPVLTKGVGRHAVTSPAQVGIAQSPSNSGGDGLAQRDTVVVQDYPDVIAEVDRIITEVDVPPLQVMIEAKILSVALSDSLQFGVNFAMLNSPKTSQLLTGNGSTLNGATGFPKSPALVPAAGDFVANTAGLKYGFIAGDIATFIEALENIADTTLVASPNLRVLNKQRAEMIIGNRVSYKTLAFNGTQTVENVNFLDAGTKLLLRPFISPDGLVRMEIHPERSKATINAQTGLPDQVTTEVTTNVMVRDGTTVVIGGLISEEVTESVDSVPFLGSIPLVGAAFRNKSEQTVRSELIVLLTPHIVVEPDACIEGEKLQFETEERAAYFRDHLSPVNRTSLTRAHYDRAVVYFEQGNLLKARQQVDAALQQNKSDMDCQRLKLRIDKAIRDQQSKAWKWPGTRTAKR